MADMKALGEDIDKCELIEGVMRTVRQEVLEYDYYYYF